MLQRFQQNIIDVEIPDREILGITLKRKAFIQSINIEMAAQRVALNLVIKYYGRNEDGSYADELNAPGISAYNRSLVADMTTIVNASTGALICNSNEEYLPDPENEGQTILNPLLDGIDYMYEFELFSAMMHSNVVVADIAVARVQVAAQDGRLN